MSTSSRAINAENVAVRTLDPQKMDDLFKLQKAAHKINSILDLDELIDKVVNDVAYSFGCVEANVYLHDEERGELVLAHAHGCTECEAHGKGHA